MPQIHTLITPVCSPFGAHIQPARTDEEKHKKIVVFESCYAVGQSIFALYIHNPTRWIQFMHCIKVDVRTHKFFIKTRASTQPPAPLDRKVSHVCFSVVRERRWPPNGRTFHRNRVKWIEWQKKFRWKQTDNTPKIGRCVPQRYSSPNKNSCTKIGSVVQRFVHHRFVIITAVWSNSCICVCVCWCNFQMKSKMNFSPNDIWIASRVKWVVYSVLPNRMAL